MNKHTSLLGILGLTVLETHSNIMGKGAHVRMTEDQLDKIEEGLKTNDTTALTETITAHESSISTLENEASDVATALTAALELNGLSAVEGSSIADQITQLGQKCKEYGDAKETHSFVPTDGIDENGDNKEPVYGFEKVLTDNSKFNTL